MLICTLIIQVCAELDRFKKLIPVEREVSPIIWWKENHTHFPALALVAKQILGIPGSAIECERVFSAAGALTGLLRDSMSPKHIHQVIVFILKSFPVDEQPSELREVNESMKKFRAMALHDDVSHNAAQLEEGEEHQERQLEAAAERSTPGVDLAVPFTGHLLALEQAGMIDVDSSRDDDQIVFETQY